jgi:ParB-like chromosome segregation protein Spo0J
MNPADKVQKWPIDKLVPYARNARTHSDEQVAQIAASIKEWGWTTPVLVDEDGGIIAGHGRTLAAQRLKMTEVPVMVAKGWSDAKKRAYVLADNKLALNAGWDDDLLKLELKELLDNEFDINLIGFGATELNLIFDGWDSDINVEEKHGENLDGISGSIRIQVSQEEKQMAIEKVTNALDSAGIEYELK